MRGLPTGLIVAAAIAGLSAGCGGKPRLYDVSGTVTWEGMPVPKGIILFDPEAPGATADEQGSANIQDGKFSTAVDGRGVRGGNYLIRILGYDGKATDALPLGQPLFEEYLERTVLPKANTELTFKLPYRR